MGVYVCVYVQLEWTERGKAKSMNYQEEGDKQVSLMEFSDEQSSSQPHHSFEIFGVLQTLSKKIGKVVGEA